MMNGFGGMGIFGWPAMIIEAIFWVGIMALLVWGAFALFPTRRSGDSGKPESAIDILKRRYAAGEINHAEFEQAMKTIN